MARDYKIRQTGGPSPAVDGDWEISKTLTVDGASTLTGAVAAASTMSVAGALTTTGGVIGVPAAIAANGTLAGAGPYIFNGASASVNMPLVASFDGYTIILANQNGTGTCLLVDDATDSAPLIVNGATGASYSLGTLATVQLTAYAAGTCWFGISG